MLDFSTREPTARSGKTCLFGAGSAGTKVMAVSYTHLTLPTNSLV